MSGVEAVIGVEVHVQLRTERKLFCADSARFGAPPNSRLCPVCMGLPGALPVLNPEAILLAVRAAAAFGCRIHERSHFDRKHYFYPDLPKGYQITQFEHPLATGGSFGDSGPPIRIRRIHLEEDAGRLLHDRFPGHTAIDLNRCGVPLIELVTEPDFRSAAETERWLRELKRAIEYLEVSDGNMEEGSLRVDANVSLRPGGGTRLGPKTEVKNLNSFTAVRRAIDREIERQRGILARGESVTPETLLWDESRDAVLPMRKKEASPDYRYFPEPDLPPLDLDRAWIDEIAAALPELPADRRERFQRELGLPAYDAGVLTASRALAEWYERVVAAGVDAKEASNWVMGPVLESVNALPGAPAVPPIEAALLAELIGKVGGGEVGRGAAKKVLRRMMETGRSADELIEAEGLARVDDADTIGRWVAEVFAEHPGEVARWRGGESRMEGYLIGRVMFRSGGRADPAEVRAGLARALEGG